MERLSFDLGHPIGNDHVPTRALVRGEHTVLVDHKVGRLVSLLNRCVRILRIRPSGVPARIDLGGTLLGARLSIGLLCGPHGRRCAHRGPHQKHGERRANQPGLAHGIPFPASHRDMAGHDTHPLYRRGIRD